MFFVRHLFEIRVYKIFSRLKRLSHLRRLLKQFSSSFFLLLLSFSTPFFENHILCNFALLRSDWTYLGMLGRAWACLGVLGRAWACLGMLGHAWACLGVLGHAWACLGVLGHVWAWFHVVSLGFA